MNESTIPDPEGEVPLTASASTPGQRLAAAREEWGLSVEDIANTLNLGTETVRSLERDDYQDLPGTTFVRGYLRNYASLLQLDPDQIVRGVDSEPEAIGDLPASRAAMRMKGQTQSRVRKKKKRGGGRLVRLLLVLAILLGVAWMAARLLPRLDMNEIAEMMKLPVSEEQEEAESEITFPAPSEDQRESKGALIPIE